MILARPNDADIYKRKIHSVLGQMMAHKKESLEEIHVYYACELYIIRFLI